MARCGIQLAMIRSFRHKGLAALFHDDQTRGVQQQHVKRLRLILARMDSVTVLEDLNAPGLRLHSLRGDLAGFCAVNGSGNWRIVFRFEAGDIFDVDYLDYHYESAMPMKNPPHPGEIIRELYLEPLELTVTQAAKDLGVARKTLSELLNGRTGISGDMAVRLSKTFGGSIAGWLQLQTNYDAAQAIARAETIQVNRRHDPAQIPQTPLAA
jgi:addiction module HigA family antidote